MAGRLRSVLLASLLLALTPSCFTVWLWGGKVTNERDEWGERDTSIERAEHDSWAHAGIAGRVLLTPVFVLLDCLTLPVQAYLYGWDRDDDEDDC